MSKVAARELAPRRVSAACLVHALQVFAAQIARPDADAGRDIFKDW
jgi:hypothetical protein